jgi:hypothetical protein
LLNIELSDAPFLVWCCEDVDKVNVDAVLVSPFNNWTFFLSPSGLSRYSHGSLPSSFGLLSPHVRRGPVKVELFPFRHSLHSFFPVDESCNLFGDDGESCSVVSDQLILSVCEGELSFHVVSDVVAPDLSSSDVGSARVLRISNS